MAYLFNIIYTKQMIDLKEFVKKRTASLPGISCRKLYGLDAFYLREIPFIVISSDEAIIVKVDDFEVQNTLLKIDNVSPWTLNNKAMNNWFLLPDTFNKKKSKLTPVLEMTSKALLHPKKEKVKRKKKSNAQKRTQMRASETVINVDDSPSLFKKIFKFMSKN